VTQISSRRETIISPREGFTFRSRYASKQGLKEPKYVSPRLEPENEGVYEHPSYPLDENFK
jgi:hypothetical protein